MQRLSHEGLGKFYESWETKKEVVLAIEYIEGTSLQQYLREKKEISMAD